MKAKNSISMIGRCIKGQGIMPPALNSAPCSSPVHIIMIARKHGFTPNLLVRTSRTGYLLVLMLKDD